MTGAAMVQPASSDFLESALTVPRSKVDILWLKLSLTSNFIFHCFKFNITMTHNCVPKIEGKLIKINNRNKGLKLYSGTSFQGTPSGPRQESLE